MLPRINFIFSFFIMIYVIIWTFLYSIANTISKYVSINFNLFKSLVFEYIFIACFWFLLIYFFDSFHIDFISNYFTFLLIWFFWYLWSRSLYAWMRHLNNWIVMMIANLYVVGAYFLNNYLIWDIEKFSTIKLTIASIFFIIISLFLFEKNEDNKFKINYKIIFPIITAISWIVYSVLCNYVVKTWVFTSFQWMFYCELFIWFFALIVFLWYSAKEWTIDLKINKKQLLSYIWISFFIFLWALWFFVWYKYIWWNYVNIISLAQIPFISLFSYIFLKDKMNKIQLLTMFFAFLTLVLFVLA